MRQAACCAMVRGFPALAPAADPFEATHLSASPPPNRWLLLASLTRADDPLRGTSIGRRDQACARRRIDRAVGDHRRRRIGTQRRSNCGVTDAARIGERPGIGRAERHARYRRITGAGRAGERRQLCECPCGGDQGKRRAENKRRIAGHRDLSRRHPSNDHVGRTFPASKSAAFASSVFAAFAPLGVGVGVRIRPNHGAVTF